MAERSSASNDHLNCSICLECYKRPKLLPCHHTFCAACLEDYIQRSSQDGVFHCPMCRQPTPVPSNGVESYQTNFYISSPKVEEKRITCDVCGPDTTASHRCLDCEENFCEVCSNAHLKMKATKQHKLLELSQADPGAKRKIISKVFCTTHKSEEIKMFCKDCSATLCIICTLTSHKTHDTTEIGDEAKNIKQKLAGLVEKDVRVRLDTLASNVHNLEEYDKKLSKSLKEDIECVDVQMRKIQESLLALATKTKEKITERHNIVIRENKEELDSARVLEREYKHAIGVAETAMGEYQDTTIVQKCMRAKSDLETLMKTSVRAHQSKRLRISFTAGEITDENLQQLIGSVTTAESQMQQISVSNISTFQVKGGYAYGIAPVQSDEAWISRLEGNTLLLVKSNGNIIKEVNLGMEVDYVIADEQGNCYVSCPVDRSIRRVSRSGIVETIVSGLELHPHGIAYRRTDTEEELLFSCTENCKVQSRCNQGSVNKISLTGTTPCVECFQQKAGVVRVAVNNERDTIVFSKYKPGEITVGSGERKCSYTGEGSSAIFCPTAGCFDNEGCIIIANTGGGNVLRISDDGSFIQELCPTATGARSVAVKGDILWVGQYDNTVNVYRISSS